MSLFADTIVSIAHSLSKARNVLLLLERPDGSGLNWQANDDGYAYLDAPLLDNSTKLLDITPSDVTVYDPPLKFITCNGADGTLSLVAQDDVAAHPVPIVSGEKIANILIKQVMAATTATLLVGGRGP
jgi:hypothetical protein